MAESGRPHSPLTVADLRRLAELRSRSDRGELAPEVFLREKRRLLEAPLAQHSLGPGPRTPLPSEELAILKVLLEEGALTREEYETLERRALLWI